MSGWDTYIARIGAEQNSDRSPTGSRLTERTSRRLRESLSYQAVKIDGVEQSVAIVDEQDFASKKIYSLPGENLEHGGIVEWQDSVWLITEKNAVSNPYYSGRMERCNYKLRWIDDHGDIITKWCIVADGTKYLIGEKTEDIMTIGDARIAITIAKDKDTVGLKRGKRFLVDDMDSKEVLAYQITKPNKLFNVYDGKGVYRFILNEVNLTDNDNVELRIADYYSWSPKKERIQSDVKVDKVFEKIAEDAIVKESEKPQTIQETKRWI